MPSIDEYTQVIKKTIGTIGEKAVQQLAKQHGLHVLDNPTFDICLSRPRWPH